MERNVLDRTVGQVLAFCLLRIGFGLSAGIVNLLFPWYIGVPFVAFLLGWMVAGLWSMRTAGCQYCGVRGGLPVRRNTANPRAVRRWYDPRLLDRRGLTWVCPNHFTAYLDERL